MIHRYRFLISMLLLMVIIGMAGEPTYTSAQTNIWRRPFELSPPIPRTIGGVAPSTQGIDDTSPVTSSWFPNIAVGPEGSVHVIWNSGAQKGKTEEDAVDILMYRALLNGQWTESNRIFVTGTGGYTIRNGIAVGPDGKINISFRGKTNIFFARSAWDKAWSAQNWSEQYPVNSLNAAYYNTLAVDSHNTLHLVWSAAILDEGKARPECSNCANMFYRQSKDGGVTWSPPINLSNSKYGDNRPQIAIDSRDRIHVVWDQGRDWYAGTGMPKRGVYMRSDDGGVSWTKPYYIEAPALDAVPRLPAGEQQSNPNAVQQTSIAVRANGNPMIVYRTVSGRIFSQTSDDGGNSWRVARQIEGVAARDQQGNDLDKFSVVFDGAGIAHLIMVGFPKALADLPAEIKDAPNLLHLSWNGTSWSRPTVISDYQAPEYPTAVISGNTLHVVWYTRNPKLENSRDVVRHYQIWYSSRLVSGQPLSAIPTYTPMPEATAIATPQPTSIPTPTPLPAAIAAAPPGGPPEWEQQGLKTILLAVLPVVGLFLGLIVFQSIRLRRR